MFIAAKYESTINRCYRTACSGWCGLFKGPITAWSRCG